jgi:hypothetical protein
MRRFVAVRSIGFLLACAGRGVAGDDLPPLVPPASGSAPAPGAATGGLPPAIEPPSSPRERSVLAVPGLVRPRAWPPSAAVGSADADLPPLIGPEMPRAAPAGRPAPPAVPQPGRVTGPLNFESVPAGESDPPSPLAPRPRRDATPAPAPGSAAPSPRRPPGLFGRLLSPPSSRRGPTDPADPITVEPRTDPAVTAALKRRIENQVREAVGDRARSVEVRVVGRDVSIRAHVPRAWQRRGVRRALESLPALSGLRPTIEVVD